MNEALLAKWLWRYWEEKDHLWRRVIVANDGEGDRWWKPKKVNKAYGITLWKALTKHWDRFGCGIMIIPGDG